MKNSRSFRRSLLCCAALALACGGPHGCSSTTDRDGPSQATAGDSASAPEEERSVASEKKKLKIVVRSPAAGREETAAATADTTVAPRPVARPSADRLHKLENGLRSLRTIPSTPAAQGARPLRSF